MELAAGSNPRALGQGDWSLLTLASHALELLWTTTIALTEGVMAPAGIQHRRLSGLAFSRQHGTDVALPVSVNAYSTSRISLPPASTRTYGAGRPLRRSRG